MTQRAHFAGLPFDDSTRQIPPGWRKGIHNYSVSKYLTKIRLWWLTRAVEDDATAALLILQRYQGTVFKQALRFSHRRDGQVHDVGERRFQLLARAADPRQ